MAGKNKRRRWQKVEIGWGISLAREMGTDPHVDEDDIGDLDAEVREELEAYFLDPLRVDDPSVLVPDAHDDDLDPLRMAVAEVRNAIARMDNMAMQKALNGAPPHDFTALLAGLRETVAARKVQAAQLRQAALAREVPPLAFDPHKGLIEEARKEVARVLEPDPLSEEDLRRGRVALEALDRAIELAAEAIRQLREAVDEIRRLSTLVTQAGYLPDQKDALKKAREDLETALNLPLSPDAQGKAQKALVELRKVAEAVRQEIEDYGDIGAIDDLCDAFGATPDTLADFEARLGGRKAMQALLKAVPAKDIKDLNAGLGPEGLAAAIDAFGGPADMAKAAGEIGGTARFVGLCSKGGSDPAKAKKLLDDLGAPFARALMTGDDPSVALSVQAAFGGDIGALQDMVAEGGFAAKPKALAAIFTAGCDADPGNFVTFCKGFDTEQAREDLAALVGDGGLGDAPDALGALVREGCDGKPAGLVALGKAFRAPPAEPQAGLKALMEQGGLAGQVGGDGDIATNTLAMMLKHGAGPRDPLTLVPEEERRAAMLKTLAAGMDGPGATRLKDCLAKGGLGTEPEVFGHLLGHGCGGGDPARLNALTTTLSTRTDKLKKMLKDGGLGQTDTTSAATNTDPECLGMLFGTGCEGRPADLATLMDALGDQDIARMKGLMVTGELGQHPKVLANLYKHGCINAPAGADDGVKNPDVLKRMMASFSNPTGTPAQFKDLLVNGGLAQPGKEERLGSLMRYAFTPKRPPNQPQNPAGLKQLHSAFNGNMGDLATTMNAIEAAPGHVLDAPVQGTANQPGQGLQNIVSSPKHAGSAANLRAGFFVPLNNRATGGAYPASMGLNALIQTAASFEHDHSPTPDVVVGNPPNDKSLRVDHIVQRHSRTHCRLSNAPGGASAKTTLYPKGVGAPEVAQKAGACIQAIPGGGGPGYRPGSEGGGQKRNPPRDKFDLPNIAVHPDPPDYFKEYFGLNDGTGMTHKMGYGKSGARNVKITQFYPEGPCPPLVKVNNRDMEALKRALI